MLRNRYLITLLMITFILVLIIALASIGHDTSHVLSYDPNPDNTVISADLRRYPGLPPLDQPCLGDYFPTLRVWGDGLVFLDISRADLKGPGQWTGTLTPEQIRSALTLLQSGGFFSGYTPIGPNPAGTSLRLASHLLSQSIVIESGDLQPAIYTQLIDRLKPLLQPISQDQSYDPRIEAILEGISSCTDSKIPSPQPEQVPTQSLFSK